MSSAPIATTKKNVKSSLHEGVVPDPRGGINGKGGGCDDGFGRVGNVQVVAGGEVGGGRIVDGDVPVKVTCC